MLCALDLSLRLTNFKLLHCVYRKYFVLKTTIININTSYTSVIEGSRTGLQFIRLKTITVYEYFAQSSRRVECFFINKLLK